MRKCIWGILILVCIGALVYNYFVPINFNEDWIIGKTEQEIVAKYGEFDTKANMPANYDKCLPKYVSSYDYGKGYYTSRFLPSETFYYAIFFDTNGVALFVEPDWYALGG